MAEKVCIFGANGTLAAAIKSFTSLSFAIASLLPFCKAILATTLAYNSEPKPYSGLDKVIFINPDELSSVNFKASF
ncbi:hypothetical protein D3C86_1138400 [compost metagenome]